MKRILLLTVSFLSLVASTGDAAMLYFNQTSMTVIEGNSFSVDLMVSGLGEGQTPSVGAFDVDILYDASQMMFTGYTLGSFLGDLSTEILDDSSGGAGTIDLAVVSLLSSAELDTLQPGTFGLATLNFKCIDLGVSTISIDKNDPSLVLGDAFGDPLSFQVGEGVEVTQTPVPEPASMLLLATGLVVLTGFGSRRRNNKA